MKELEISAILYQEDGWWCAQCLEYDIVVQATTLTDVQLELFRSLFSQIIVSVELGRTPFAGISQAPQRYWEMFEAARTTILREEPPLRAPSQASHMTVNPHLKIAEQRAAA